MIVSFFLEEVDDVYIRDNFKKLQDAIKKDVVLNSDFKFYEITVPKAVVRFSYEHHLTSTPKDVILLSVTGDQDVTFHYSSFTKTNIVFTTTGACTFRVFVGTYRGGV